MISYPSIEIVREKRDAVLERIYNHHLREFADADGKIFFISDAYPGVWLEHTYDPVCWADYMPSEAAVPKAQIELFIKHQTDEGQLPCFIWKNKIGYSQIQECVSFGSLCVEAWKQNGCDKEFLEKCYSACVKWDGWQVAKRMPHGTGLIEMFCGFDTGHDNSGRWKGMKYHGNVCEDGGIMPEDDPILPILACDMNAVFYGDRKALSEMASHLGRDEEAKAWKEKADDVRRAMNDIMWDEADCFYYDTDIDGTKRKVKSIAITNVICEGVPDDARADDIFERHLHNPKEFWTPYPFPAVAIDEPTWVRELPGNSWGYYTQGLTGQRTLRWMDRLGKHDEEEFIMKRWIEAWCASTTTQFGQELVPMTGEPSKSSEWYSAGELFFLQAVRRIHGI